MNKWIALAERQPTPEDMDDKGEVLAHHAAEGWSNTVGLDELNSAEYDYWMPIPKLSVQLANLGAVG